MLYTSHSERLTRRYMCKMKMAPLKVKREFPKTKMGGAFTVIHQPLENCIKGGVMIYNF